MSTRITPFEPEHLSPQASAVHARILKERGYLPGPYRFWLAAPQFADCIEPLEDHLRHGVALEARQVEIVVLSVARFWRSAYVWSSHAPAAERAGVPVEVVAAIRTGSTPIFSADADALCHGLSRALLEARAVDDDMWARAHSDLGEGRINEILGLLGLYTSVCLTMVAYQMPAKDGPVDPFA